MKTDARVFFEWSFEGVFFYVDDQAFRELKTPITFCQSRRPKPLVNCNSQNVARLPSQVKISFRTVSTSSVISAFLASSPLRRATASSSFYIVLDVSSLPEEKSMEIENKSTTNSRKLILTKAINVIEFANIPQ